MSAPDRAATESTGNHGETDSPRIRTRKGPRCKSAIVHEKLLIEACLELMATDAIVAIQDMGAAGLTSSSVEMASKGGAGIRLFMD